MIDVRSVKPGRVIDLAQELRSPVHVGRIRDVALAVVAGPAREHAIGAEVNQPGAYVLAQVAQLMREQRVDLNRERRRLRVRALLDEPDAIDDGLGRDGLDHVRNAVEVAHVDVADRVALREQLELTIGGDGPAQRDADVVSGAEALQQLVAQHAVAADDQDSHVALILSTSS